MAVCERGIVQLDDKLKTADVVLAFLAVLGSPSHLQQRGNRNRSIEHPQATAHERVRLEGTRTKDAKTAIAEIMNSTIEFLWPGTRART